MLNSLAAKIAKKIPVEDRKDARDIALYSWSASGFNEAKARKIAAEKVSQWKKSRCESSGVGSIIVILTISALMLQLIYYAIKIFRQWNATVVSSSNADEIFGL